MSRQQAAGHTLTLVAVLVLAAVAGVTALPGCKGKSNPVAPIPGPGGRSTTINIVPGAASKGTQAFTPNPDTVSAGVPITMKNGDSMNHYIESNPSGAFAWGALAGGASRPFTFTTPGTFQYHCIIPGHTMDGTIVVQ